MEESSREVIGNQLPLYSPLPLIPELINVFLYTYVKHFSIGDQNWIPVFGHLFFIGFMSFIFDKLAPQINVLKHALNQFYSLFQCKRQSQKC